MANLLNASFSTAKFVDKTVYTLSGQFTYTYTTSDVGGNYTIPNPEPGVIFLPDSIFSIDGGETWFGDLEKEGAAVLLTPDINTISTVSSIIYRWGSYGVSGTKTVIYRTKLLAYE